MSFLYRDLKPYYGGSLVSPNKLIIIFLLWTLHCLHPTSLMRHRPWSSLSCRHHLLSYPLSPLIYLQDCYDGRRSNAMMSLMAQKSSIKLTRLHKNYYVNTNNIDTQTYFTNRLLRFTGRVYIVYICRYLQKNVHGYLKRNS